MKKICVSILALICMIISVSAVSVSAAKITYMRGDADGDSFVTISDVTRIQRVLADLEKDPNGIVKRNGDVDNNGLDITDATKIQMYLAEFNDPYAIGKTITFDEYELPFIPNN